MKKITRELANELGFDFDLLLLNISYHKYEHRKADTFFVNATVEINEKYHSQAPRFLDGLYLTNDFVVQDGWGYDYEDIYELLPVEWVTEVVTIKKKELKFIQIID